MKVEVKYFVSPDVDLADFQPGDGEDFSFLLQAIVGPVGMPDAGESIQFTVCTVNSLKGVVASEGVIFGRPLVIVDTANLRLITDRIKQVIESVEAPTWEEIGQKFSRLGVYEFEDA